MNLLLSDFEAVTGLPNAFGYATAALLGAMIGSFLNVVIHRVPREESIVFPNSACPECGSAIRPYDNIPVVSWLVLGGKCRNCKARISPRYIAVEALTAALFLLTYWKVGFEPMLPVALVFVSAMVALIFIDAEHMILPNVITYPLFVFALIARVALPLIAGGDPFGDAYSWPASAMPGPWPIWAVSIVSALAGAIAGGGFLWAVGEAWKRLRGVEAMGLGDVKMMLGVGALLGWQLTLLTIFAGAFGGALIGSVLIAMKKQKDLQAHIPFGIFLGLGSIVSLLFGRELIDWYISTFIR
ncbi:MAG: prepilin peptidase [Pyrinomonadaceae bacterium]